MAARDPGTIPKGVVPSSANLRPSRLGGHPHEPLLPTRPLFLAPGLVPGGGRLVRNQARGGRLRYVSPLFRFRRGSVRNASDGSGRIVGKAEVIRSSSSRNRPASQILRGKAATASRLCSVRPFLNYTTRTTFFVSIILCI